MPGWPWVRPLALGLLLLVLPTTSRGGDRRVVFVEEVGEEPYRFLSDLVASPDGHYLYAADNSRGQISIYARNPDTGALWKQSAFGPALNPFLMTISPGGGHLYALAHDGGGLALMRRDPALGLLTMIGTANAPPYPDGDYPLLGAEGMAMSPEGTHLYVTGSYHAVVAVFARDPDTGQLEFVELHQDGRDGISGMDGPVGIAVSPDGTNVYVAGFYGDTLVVFEREPATGRLRWVETYHHGTFRGWLRNAFGLTVSPDGRHVYVVTDRGVSTYRRQQPSGRLVHVAGTIDGVDHDVWLTADGRHAFGCGSGSTLVAYTRDSASGALLDGERFAGGFGVTAPAFCFGMTITPDGGSLYTIDTYHHTVPDHHYEYRIGVFRYSDAPSDSTTTTSSTTTTTVCRPEQCDDRNPCTREACIDGRCRSSVPQGVASAACLCQHARWFFCGASDLARTTGRLARVCARLDEASREDEESSRRARLGPTSRRLLRLERRARDHGRPACARALRVVRETVRRVSAPR
jgi:6-phosphogluconolactonase (cycloisomerase 2 family)